MEIITHDFGQMGQQFSLWRALQNADDKTLQHLYRWLHGEHLLVPLLSKTLHYPFLQPKPYLSEESGSSLNGKTLHDTE